MEEVKFKAKRIDNADWVSGHYFTSPLTDENSGTTPDKGWFFLTGEKRHCIEQNHVVFVVDPDTIKRDYGIDEEGRFFGPFNPEEKTDRVRVLLMYIGLLDTKRYNEQPLCIRQALEFLYDCVKDYKIESTRCADVIPEVCNSEVASNGI